MEKQTLELWSTAEIFQVNGIWPRSNSILKETVITWVKNILSPTKIALEVGTYSKLVAYLVPKKQVPTDLKTRMHSSRMCTARELNISGGGGLPASWHCGKWHCGKYEWKHYLPGTSFSGGINTGRIWRRSWFYAEKKNWTCCYSTTDKIEKMQMFVLN